MPLISASRVTAEDVVTKIRPTSHGLDYDTAESGLIGPAEDAVNEALVTFVHFTRIDILGDEPARDIFVAECQLSSVSRHRLAEAFVTNVARVTRSSFDGS